MNSKLPAGTKKAKIKAVMHTQLSAKHHNDREARQSGKKTQKTKAANTTRGNGSDINLCSSRELKVKLNRALWWLRGKHESINYKE